MPRTNAEDRAIKKYEQEKLDHVLLRMPKGKKAVVQTHAKQRGESLNAFLNRAIDETIFNDNKNF